MVKAYTSQDIDFAGDNTFSGEVDVNSSKVTSVDTPSAIGDGATKGYVDSMETGYDESDEATYTGSEGSTTNITSVTVNVEEGQYVLLLACGNTDVNGDDGEETNIWFRRDSTDLNNNANSYVLVVDNEGGESNDDTFSFLMHYIDVTPGTGSVTYYLRGYAEDYLDVRLTAIVLKQY